ncbi:sigma 54-interacting transcriptional regulator [Halarsenatibacter silvermanii]|uniref:PAS domain S-box-containing protein n=1 Tax=Halarsenatibacter silvermanii TaxID=321763 RepID=A0A1G9R6I5_9FIRM|nr:sigma 54-interacting transcriptional regulator [Halarsenatibacter silvermanii]SDM18828.1 PAS domain S-box-containing protein [Halarsenatibacter silvermanii]
MLLNEKITEEFKQNDRFSDWLQALLNSVYNGIIAVDEIGKVVYCNRSAEHIIEINRNKILGRDIKEILPKSGLLQTLEKGEPELSDRLTIKGKEIFSNRTPIFQGGELKGAIAVFQELNDITKLQGRLEDARHQLQIFDAILNKVYEGVIIVDQNGYITKFNKAYQEFLGVDEEDMVSEHVTDVIENTRMHKIIQTGEKEVGHIQRIHGNDMICSRHPIFEGEKIIGAVGIVHFQDIEELRSLAMRLEIMEDHLGKFKGEFKRLQEAKYSFDNILTKNPKMKYLKEMAGRAAENNSSVLIEGETGTGKELFAHAIHEASYRKYGSFIRVNCAAIPRDLLESELFGYEEGAFTGAKEEGKPGKFEMADGGTIFLDEISCMPKEMQAKLLRVLEEGEFTRVGSTQSNQLDVRVIAATNENLEKKIQAGDFREDLYYRLNVVRISIPPLRERREDIPLLARKKLKDLIAELTLEEKIFSDQTIKQLKAYSWPGNVRELFNVVERAVNTTDNRLIQTRHLPEIIGKEKPDVDENDQDDIDIDINDDLDLNQNIEELEKKSIKKALEITGNNKSKAAEILGIHRTSLYNKLKKYNLK